jgi:hypothetical protein
MAEFVDEYKELVYEDICSKYPHGLLRKFMDSEEIRAANQLVKEGRVRKGKGEEKNATVSYYKV